VKLWLLQGTERGVCNFWHPVLAAMIWSLLSMQSMLLSAVASCFIRWSFCKCFVRLYCFV
jgi:hypothetical protein